MIFIKKFFGHLNTINIHRLNVFKLCLKAGIPIRGILHDISKYSPIEFFEGVKYWDGGKHSPTENVKKDKGYSKAWLHHRGRNKHHFEYWVDLVNPEKSAIIPYKYLVEMICDQIAAGKTYHPESWNDSNPLNYLKSRKDTKYINPKIYAVLEEFFELMAKEGLEKSLNSKTLREIYNKNVNKS